MKHVSLWVFLAASFARAQDDDPAGLMSGGDSYAFNTPNRVTLGTGPTLVSAESNSTSPATGYFPLVVNIDNSGGPRQAVRLEYRSLNNSDGNRVISKTVEVAAGSRENAVLTLPTAMHFGALTARGAGINGKATSQVYFNQAYAPTRALLTLSTPEQFTALVKQAPASRASTTLLVQPISPQNAPTELAAYVGWPAVVIPQLPLDSFDEAQRSALEAYAATGGTLILGTAAKGSEQALPLAIGAQGAYGFGRVLRCDGNCAPLVYRAFSKPSVLPQQARPGDRYGGGDEKSALLTQAIAPVGQFLSIIFFFTLAIGPGSYLIARRRGSAALLVTIPTTAFVTCAAIVTYSAWHDGFNVHAGAYGYTLLDSAHHRAITLGITAYYANLSPSTARFSNSSAIFGAGEEAPSIDWSDGQRVSDFLPSRSYREWGSVSVEPTRARVVARREGGRVWVQNALGFDAEVLRVRMGGSVFEAKAVRDGQEAVAGASVGGEDPVTRAAPGRFATSVPLLTDGRFEAVLKGQGFIPSGGLRLTHHQSTQLVLGELER